MKITTTAYNDMLKTVGTRPAESGGLLFGSRTDWVVTKFLYDKNAKTTRSSYSFDVGYLNPMMDELTKEGLQLLGFFHSHPRGYTELSTSDKIYFQRQFNNIPVEKFYTPLMFSAVDGSYDFVPYIFHKNGKIEKVTLELVPDDYKDYITKPKATPSKTNHFSFATYHRILWSTFYTGLLVFSLWLLFFLCSYLSNLLNDTL